MPGKLPNGNSAIQRRNKCKSQYNSAERDLAGFHPTGIMPPQFRRPPHYEKLPEIAEALPSDGDEALAERIRKDTKIPIKLARALVDKFGTARVKNALRSDFVKTARKPGGALRHLLEKQAIEPDDNLSSSRVEGDYEDFIKR